MHIDKNLKELEKHGTNELPLAFYDDNCQIFKAIYAHWHEEMEIIYITRGKGFVRLNDELVQIETGDIILIGKETIHYIQSDKDDILYFKSLVFNLNIIYSYLGDACQIELVDPLMNNKFEIKSVLKKENKHYSQFLKIYLNIIEVYCKKEKYFYIKIKGLFFELFYEMFKADVIRNVDISKTRKTSKMKVILDYIDNHYYENMTINNLAQMMHYNEYYFMKIFKQYTGKTFIYYINEIRIEKSKYLILNTDLSITEIATKVGFNNTSYYIKKFQHLQGITPHKFRKISM